MRIMFAFTTCGDVRVNVRQNVCALAAERLYDARRLFTSADEYSHVCQREAPGSLAQFIDSLRSAG